MNIFIIDSKKQLIYKKFIDGDIQEVYDLLGVQLIERVETDDLLISHLPPTAIDNITNDLYVDEEGLINGTQVGFFIGNYQYMGSGVIIGCIPQTGVWAPAEITLEIIEPLITFF